MGHEMIKLTLYRDDSTAQVVFEHVKHWFWTANNTVLVIAQLSPPAPGATPTRPPGQNLHHYIMWPRERFCWFKDERV